MEERRSANLFLFNFSRFDTVRGKLAGISFPKIVKLELVET